MCRGLHRYHICNLATCLLMSKVKVNHHVSQDTGKVTKVQFTFRLYVTLFWEFQITFLSKKVAILYLCITSIIHKKYQYYEHFQL